MTVHEQTISRICDLPVNIVEQINSFIDFMIMDGDDEAWSLWQDFREVSTRNPLKFAEYPSQEEELDIYLDSEEVCWLE